jgi:hypothetical protein
MHFSFLCFNFNCTVQFREIEGCKLATLKHISFSVPHIKYYFYQIRVTGLNESVICWVTYISWIWQIIYRRELQRKLINLDLGFKGTYDLLDSHQSLLNQTSVFLCRLDVSNLILKDHLRNWNMRTQRTRLKKYSLNSQISFKHTRNPGHIFLTSKQLVVPCHWTGLWWELTEYVVPFSNYRCFGFTKGTGVVEN